MPKKTPVLDNKSLSGYSELFKSTALYAAEETVTAIPLIELHPPEFHPFQVKDDESMDRLYQNIQKYGVREPGLARPRQSGGYELIAGNRRKRACELAGLPTMPVIIREMDDNSATIAMVDSNLEQREQLLFSEKAWAYKVKMEALNHNGIKGDKHSYELLMEQTGESKNQIFRLIRLTELVVGLLDKVDAKQLAFNPAVELSYLSQLEQTAVVSAMESHGIKPSFSQAVRLKQMKQAGSLTIDAIDTILAECKKSHKDEKEINQFKHYFPEDYSSRQMVEVITELLQAWQLQQAG